MPEEQKIKQIKPEEQRAHIAKLCGWTLDNVGMWLSPNKDICSLPHYLEDLNAMHEAEKTIKDESVGQKYYQLLESVTDHDPIVATAEQRATAFLLTTGEAN